MSVRKTSLIDCHPRWVLSNDGTPCGVWFECPEGHADCSHSIPFTPSLDGSPAPSWQMNGAIWQRTGDTFETLTLSPSIRRIPRHASREAAIASGCIPEYVTEAMLCAWHGFVGGSSRQMPGQIEFCGDSR